MPKRRVRAGGQRVVDDSVAKTPATTNEDAEADIEELVVGHHDVARLHHHHTHLSWRRADGEAHASNREALNADVGRVHDHDIHRAIGNMAIADDDIHCVLHTDSNSGEVAGALDLLTVEVKCH